MIRLIQFIFLLLFAIPLVGQTDPYINEVNYSSDPPCIEIVTPVETDENGNPVTTDLTDWKLIPYNENGEIIEDNQGQGQEQDVLQGSPTQTIGNGLNFIIVDVIIFADDNTGIALVNPTGEVVQFISFGSDIVANEGPADGLTSDNIGMQTDPANSLQLIGDEWDNENPSTCGSPNVSQAVSAVSALPVELAYFKGSKDREGIQIEWKTLSEINSDYFLLEKSKDAQNWELLDQITSNGNTLESITYRVLDKNPLDGHTYYRLSQFDFDGTKEVFNIISVYTQPKKGEVRIYPNPGNTDFLDLKLPVADGYQDLKVRVIDIYGRTTSFQTSSNGQVDVHQLKSGVYSVQIISETEEYNLIYIRSEK